MAGQNAVGELDVLGEEPLVVKAIDERDPAPRHDSEQEQQRDANRDGASVP